MEEPKINLPPKIRPRYNWSALKLEFLRGPWSRVDEFRRFKGWPNRRTGIWVNKNTVGWTEEKHKILSIAAERAAQDLIADKTDEIRIALERQTKLSQKMQDKGEKALGGLDVKAVDDARKLILTGMEQERAALRVGKGGAKSLTQVNVNLPKTRFDELVNDQDFEGLLRFITDIRRERTRRIGEGVTVESKGEADK